ncbi:MAG: scaffolding protein [Christensenellaceae bacterium]|nr:scaffolding protein [Christensenellaceae bacterium]
MLEWLKTILGDSYTEEIDKAVSKELGKAFVSRADFNAVNEEKKNLASQLAERDAQLEELKKVDAAGLQAKITELQNQNAQTKAEFENELKKVKLNSTLEMRLIKDGAVNTKAVMALLDLSKISLDGDKLIGYDDQVKALKETEKWAFQTGAPGKTGMEQNPGPTGERTLADDIMARLYPNSKQ